MTFFVVFLALSIFATSYIGVYFIYPLQYNLLVEYCSNLVNIKYNAIIFLISYCIYLYIGIFLYCMIIRILSKYKKFNYNIVESISDLKSLLFVFVVSLVTSMLIPISKNILKPYEDLIKSINWDVFGILIGIMGILLTFSKINNQSYSPTPNNPLLSSEGDKIARANPKKEDEKKSFFHEFLTNSICLQITIFFIAIVSSISIYVVYHLKIIDMEPSELLPIYTLIIGFTTCSLTFLTANDTLKRNAENTRKQVEASLKKQIVQHRQAWINDMRSLSINFLDFASRMDHELTPDERKEASQYIHNFHMYMNPSDFFYTPIIKTVNKVKQAYENISFELEKNKFYEKQETKYKIMDVISYNSLESQNYRNFLEFYMQCLLKAEWTRIKDILESKENTDNDFYSREIYYALIPKIAKCDDLLMCRQPFNKDKDLYLSFLFKSLDENVKEQIKDKFNSEEEIFINNKSFIELESRHSHGQKLTPEEYIAYAWGSMVKEYILK